MAGPIDGRRGIGPQGPQGPQGPIGPGESAGPDKAKKVFDVAGTERAAEQIKKVVRENYDAVRNRIQDGLRRGLSKEQILHELTRDELTDAFGPTVSQGMVAAVAKAVTEEPSLSQVFGRLFDKAGAE